MEGELWLEMHYSFTKIGPGLWKVVHQTEDLPDELAIEVDDDQMGVILDAGGMGYYLPGGQGVAWVQTE